MRTKIQEIPTTNESLINFDDDIVRSMIAWCEQNPWEKIKCDEPGQEAAAVCVFNISKSYLKLKILPKIPQEEHYRYNNELGILTVAEHLCKNREGLDQNFYKNYVVKKYYRDIDSALKRPTKEKSEIRDSIETIKEKVFSILF